MAIQFNRMPVSPGVYRMEFWLPVGINAEFLEQTMTQKAADIADKFSDSPCTIGIFYQGQADAYGNVTISPESRNLLYGDYFEQNYFSQEEPPPGVLFFPGLFAFYKFYDNPSIARAIGFYMIVKQQLAEDPGEGNFVFDVDDNGNVTAQQPQQTEQQMEGYGLGRYPNLGAAWAAVVPVLLHIVQILVYLFIAWAIWDGVKAGINAMVRLVKAGYTKAGEKLQQWYNNAPAPLKYIMDKFAAFAAGLAGLFGGFFNLIMICGIGFGIYKAVQYATEKAALAPAAKPKALLPAKKKKGAVLKEVEAEE